MALKVSISYPPIPEAKAEPMLGQQRQFQYFEKPTFNLPVIPASLASTLHAKGYEVIWDDALAEQENYTDWIRNTINAGQDVMFLESKAPVIKKHWRIIDELKRRLPDMKIVLMGDHVTAFPHETLSNSKVDFILEGGLYDFKGIELVDFLSGKSDKMPAGFYVRKDKEHTYTGKSVTRYNLDSLPMIDRDLTKFWLYSKVNGNFKYHPGAYTMVGRDCWYRPNGGCSFCSWTITYPEFMVEGVDRALDEVGHLISHYGIKEIFDDTGTFPTGIWLKKFCEGMIERGYNKEVKIGCNMRVSAVNREAYALMKKAGFRFILYGIESANQKTLDYLNKGVKAEQQLPSIRDASLAGLDPHITIMFGYPWEDKNDVQRTLQLGREMVRRQYAKTWQVTIVIPYPGTALFKQCKENNWLLTEDWDAYDMRMPVMKTPLDPEELMNTIQKFYDVAFSPEFMLRRLYSIRSWNDLKYLWFGFKKVLGHKEDFAVDQLKHTQA